MKRTILLLLGVLVLAGCITQNPYIPVRRYQIDESPLITAPREKAIDASIAVLDLRSRPRYEQRMLRRDTSGEITYKEYDRWVEQPAEMAGSLMMRALTESGAFRNVGPARSSRSSQYVVDGDIISFDQVTSGKENHAEFAARLELRRVDDGRILWSETFEKSVPMAADTGAALADAMSKAAREAITDAAGKIAAAAEQDFNTKVSQDKRG
jgi:ABC-type uncharacterized transport system auxiliary subunit